MGESLLPHRTPAPLPPVLELFRLYEIVPLDENGTLEKSTVDWCEDNYDVTEYVAEFWNTLSSLAIVLAGLLGLIIHLRMHHGHRHHDLLPSLRVVDTASTSEKDAAGGGKQRKNSSGGSSSPAQSPRARRRNSSAVAAKEHSAKGIVAEMLGGELCHSGKHLLRAAAPLEWRFRIAFLLIIVIGVGSMLFHATLLFHMQWLDETPMILVALVMAYSILEHGAPAGGYLYGRRLAVGTFIYAVVAVRLSTLSLGPTQFWVFQTVYGIPAWGALWWTYRLVRQYRRGEWGYQLHEIGDLTYLDDSRTVPRLFAVGVSSFWVGFACWIADQVVCQDNSSALGPIYLHAIWHVGVSIGLYTLMLVHVMHRQHRLGHVVRLKWVWGFFPVLRCADVHKER